MIRTIGREINELVVDESQPALLRAVARELEIVYAALEAMIADNFAGPTLNNLDMRIAASRDGRDRYKLTAAQELLRHLDEAADR